MAVTLAAAGRLGAVHHCLEPAGHVHLQHLVASDEAVLLDGNHGRDRGEWQVSGVMGRRGAASPVRGLTSSLWYFGLFL